MTRTSIAPRVAVGDLPLWKGVQDKPGTIPLSFAFGFEQGLIRLAVESAILDQVTQHYGEADYSFITSPPGTSEWGNQRGNIHFEELAKSAGPLNGKTVLEIGSGTLYIAQRVASELGVQKLIACDPALQSQSPAKAIEVVREYFTKDSFKGDSFDAVLSINNLEHIPNPFEYLSTIRALLEKNAGAFFVVVPDCERSLRSGDVGICLHEHLSYFTESSLRSVLALCGLSVEYLHKQDDTLFALARPSAPAILDVAQAESLLREFETKMTTSLDHARRMVERHRNDTPLAIHGCSVGLNNILHLLKLRHVEGLELFDGDSNKTGRYLGAYDRPIISSADERYPHMRTVLIAASTFHDPIKRFAIGRGIAAERILPLTPL